MAREIVYKFSSCFINDIRSRRRVPPLIRQMCHPCSRWMQLRAAHQSLKTPDAIHLAAARHHSCAELWTNDGRLNSIAQGIAIKVI